MHHVLRKNTLTFLNAVLTAQQKAQCNHPLKKMIIRRDGKDCLILECQRLHGQEEKEYDNKCFVHYAKNLTQFKLDWQITTCKLSLVHHLFFESTLIGT